MSSHLIPNKTQIKKGEEIEDEENVEAESVPEEEKGEASEMSTFIKSLNR